MRSTASKSDWQPALDAYHASLKRAAELCAQFVRDAGANGEPRWLTLSGVTGCGKTMLAEQTFREAMKFNPGAAAVWIGGRGIYRDEMRRPGAVWLAETAFADRIRRAEYDLPEWLARDYLVAVDDVGLTRDPTKFVAEALVRLANARLGKWTLFTTNFSLRELADRIDERFASRVIRNGSQFHRIEAGDYAMRGGRT